MNEKKEAKKYKQNSEAAKSLDVFLLVLSVGLAVLAMIVLFT